MHDFARPSDFVVFLVHKIAYSQDAAPILMQNTSNDQLYPWMCLFGITKQN